MMSTWLQLTKFSRFSFKFFIDKYTLIMFDALQYNKTSVKLSSCQTKISKSNVFFPALAKNTFFLEIKFLKFPPFFVPNILIIFNYVPVSMFIFYGLLSFDLILIINLWVFVFTLFNKQMILQLTATKNLKNFNKI